MSRCLSYKTYEMFDMWLSSTKRNFQIIYNVIFFQISPLEESRNLINNYKDYNFLNVKKKRFPHTLINTIMYL